MRAFFAVWIWIWSKDEWNCCANPISHLISGIMAIKYLCFVYVLLNKQMNCLQFDRLGIDMLRATARNFKKTSNELWRCTKKTNTGISKYFLSDKSVELGAAFSCLLKSETFVWIMKWVVSWIIEVNWIFFWKYRYINLQRETKISFLSFLNTNICSERDLSSAFLSFSKQKNGRLLQVKNSPAAWQTLIEFVHYI